MKQYGRASLRRCLAALFAALMVFSVLPLTAMAEGIEGPSDNAAKAAVGGDAEALAIGGVCENGRGASGNKDFGTRRACFQKRLDNEGRAFGLREKIRQVAVR